MEDEENFTFPEGTGLEQFLPGLEPEGRDMGDIEDPEIMDALAILSGAKLDSRQTREKLEAEIGRGRTKVLLKDAKTKIRYSVEDYKTVVYDLSNPVEAKTYSEFIQDWAPRSLNDPKKYRIVQSPIQVVPHQGTNRVSVIRIVESWIEDQQEELLVPDVSFVPSMSENRAQDSRAD